MSFNLEEVSAFMISNGYILPLGQGKFKLSTKFHLEMKPILQKPVRLLTTLPKTVIDTRIGNYKGDFGLAWKEVGSSNWEDHYKQFIIEAKVPRQLENSKGDAYTTNSYSEKGMKAFRKAIESGTDLNLLVKTTALYYKSSIRYKVAIGRFIEEGIWKTFYDQLKNAVDNGEEALIKHIKDETDNGTSNRYELG